MSVTVTHEEGENPSVLAEAAVASAAVSGAAAAKADSAQDDAAQALAQAQGAQDAAARALETAASTPTLSEEDVRRIAREEHEATLAAILAKANATPEPVVVTPETVDPQIQPPLPKSAQDAGGKKSTKRSAWARAWEGGE